jgi:hypothetical protein
VKIKNFTRTPDQCRNSKPEQNEPRFIRVHETIEQCIEVVGNNVILETNPRFRKPPLCISRLARSGKTTILYYLFEALKKQNDTDVISISLNGNSEFTRRDGESALQCITRQIALQLTDLLKGVKPEEVEVDDEALKECIDSYAVTNPENKLVLLIDELNMLGSPIDLQASKFLKDIFLDPMNRYLVYTTHVPLAIDRDVNSNALTGSSLRVVKSVDMPMSINSEELQEMFETKTVQVQRADPVLYLGIPALIFSMKRGDVKLEERVASSFNAWTEQYGIPTDAQKAALLKDFLVDFLKGSVESAGQLKFFDQFSSIDREDKKSFPLSYVGPVIAKLANPLSSLSIIYRVESLIKEDIPVSFKKSQSGEEWERIVELATLLQCLLIEQTKGPFIFMRKVESKIRKIFYDELPNRIETLDQAYEFIKVAIAREAPLTLTVYRPRNVRYNHLDCMFVYKPVSGPERITGYQVKRGEKKISNEDLVKPFKQYDWLEEVFWILGKPSKRAENSYEKVAILNENELKQLLGYSLEPFLPSLLDALGEE